MNRRVGTFSILAAILLYGTAAFAQQSEATLEYGQIRLTFEPFPYVNDPSGIDMGSYARMGELAAYVVRIYPATFLKPLRRAMQEGVEWFSSAPDLNSIAVKGEPLKLVTRSRQSILNVLARGGALAVYIVPSPVMPFLMIPAPPGEYYIEYSLYFPNGRTVNQLGNGVHPNYPDKGAPSIVWGPPRVSIISGAQVNVDFQPSNNMNFYQYHGPQDGGWGDDQAMKDWLRYLVFVGALP